jgi:hypothetical protein
MKSLADVQTALYKVLNAVADHRLPHQRAGRILFDLEQVALTLRQPSASRR